MISFNEMSSPSIVDTHLSFHKLSLLWYQGIALR